MTRYVLSYRDDAVEAAIVDLAIAASCRAAVGGSDSARRGSDLPVPAEGTQSIACFSAPGAARPFGIDFDINLCLRYRLDPSALLLHEWSTRGNGAPIRAAWRISYLAEVEATYGYEDSPLEREAARRVSRVERQLTSLRSFRRLTSRPR